MVWTMSILNTATIVSVKAKSTWFVLVGFDLESKMLTCKQFCLQVHFPHWEFKTCFYGPPPCLFFFKSKGRIFTARLAFLFHLQIGLWWAFCAWCLTVSWTSNCIIRISLLFNIRIASWIFNSSSYITVVETGPDFLGTKKKAVFLHLAFIALLEYF